MSKLSVTLAAAASASPPAWPILSAGARAERHRSARSSSTAPIPARARPTTRSVVCARKPEERALSHSRSATSGRLAAVAPKPGPTSAISFRDRTAAPASTAARRSGPAVSPAARAGDQPGVQASAKADAGRRSRRRRMTVSPARSRAFSVAIQRIDLRFRAHPSGTEPCPSTASWKRRRSNLSPSAFSALRAQLADLQLARACRRAPGPDWRCSG